MSNSEEADVYWYDWINHPVLVEDTMLGTLKYVGNTDFGDGLWCGIELKKPLGTNDGMVNNVRYFTCEPMFGLFVPSYKITKVKISNLEEQVLECEQFNKTYGIQELPLCNTVTSIVEVDSCKLDCKKISKSRSDSEESLGILNDDLIDLKTSLDSPIYDSSFNTPLNNPELKAEGSDFVLSSLKTELSDEFCCPISASTPRHPKIKQRMFEYPLALKEEDDDENFIFEEKSCFTTELFFDVDKLKNTPSLSSTTKNLINFDNYNMLEKVLTIPTESESTIKKDKEFLNKNLTFQNSYLSSSQNANVTYELSENFSPVVQYATVPKTSLTKNSFVTTGDSEEVDENENGSRLKNLSKIDLNLKENTEFNATFELKGSDNKLKVETVNSILISKLNKTVNLSKEKFPVSPSDGSSSNINKIDSVMKQTFVIDSSMNDSCSPKQENDIFEDCNIRPIEMNSFATKNQYFPEKNTSLSDISSEVFNEQSSSNCNFVTSTEKLFDSVVTLNLNSTFQKLNEVQLKDTFSSVENNQNYPKKFYNVKESNLKTNQGFKKPFSPISKFKRTSQVQNLSDIKSLKEEKSSTHDKFRFNKKESISSKPSLNSDFSKQEKLKKTKRLSLTSCSNLESFTKQNSIYSRRSSLSSVEKLKVNFDKQETLKCSKALLVSNSNFNKKEKGVNRSEVKLENSSNFEKSSNLLKLKTNQNSLKVPSKLIKKSQGFQSSEISQSVRSTNIRKNEANLSDSFHHEKPHLSKLGTKLKYSLSIPKSSNVKSKIIQSSQICTSVKVSNNITEFSIQKDDLNKTNIVYKPKEDLNKCLKTKSNLLKKTPIIEVSKKIIPSHEKIEKNNSTEKSQRSLPITRKNMKDSELTKKTACEIQRLKISSVDEVSSGRKIPLFKSKNISTGPPIGIIKPRFSMIHPIKEINKKELETENLKPSQILQSSNLNLIASSQSVINCSSSDKSGKETGLEKKTVLSLNNKKTSDEKPGRSHSNLKEPRKIPRYSLSSSSDMKK